MASLKHIAEIIFGLVGAALLIWLKYWSIKQSDTTIFSHDKGPQTLFGSEEKKP